MNHALAHPRSSLGQSFRNYAGFEHKLILFDRECKCDPAYAEYGGNTYAVGYDVWRDSGPNKHWGVGPSRESEAYPAIRRAISLGLFGGMDVYDLPTNSAVDTLYSARYRVKEDDVFADLSEFLAKGLERTNTLDMPSIDLIGEMLPLMSDVYLTSRDALIGIPYSIKAIRLVHKADVAQLNTPGYTYTWEEYVAELDRLSLLDRDANGTPDKSFCLPSSSLEWTRRPFMYIASSVFQTSGPQDLMAFNTADPRGKSNADTVAMRYALSIFRKIYANLDLTWDAKGFSEGTCACTLQAVRSSFSPAVLPARPTRGMLLAALRGGTALPCPPPTGHPSSWPSTCHLHTYSPPAFRPIRTERWPGFLSACS